MAANGQVWNIFVEGVPYMIEFKKNKISVNNGEPVKINKLKKEGSILETKYVLPIQGKEVGVHIRQSAQPILTIDGRVWNTGEEYVPTKMPAWGWVFIVLYVLNFFLLIGGAVGGALSAGLAMLSAGIAADKKKSTVVRVVICLAIWVAATIGEFFLALMIAGI